MKHLLVLAVLCAGCPAAELPVVDAGADVDAGMSSDAGPVDAGPVDAGPVDAGPVDAGPPDAGPPDGGLAAPLVTAQGGRVLKRLKLVTVTFANDPDAALKESFGDWIVGSSWLAAAGEYGVQTGSHLSKVKITTNAPASVSRVDLETFVAARIADGTLPALPTDQSDILIALYYPASTTLTLGGYVHCTSFSGYHSEVKAGGKRVAFAAIGACPNYVSGLTPTENMMRTASHEIIEAATDPFDLTAPAYVVLDQKNPWYFFAGEVADICPLSQVVREAGFLAQRYWSNQAVTATKDPCVPAPAGELPYITAVSPVETQTVDAGDSITFTLTGVAAPADPAWTLQATSSIGDFDSLPMLDATTSKNGQKSHLTLKVPAGTASGKYAVVRLYSYRSTTDYHFWPVAIVAR